MALDRPWGWLSPTSIQTDAEWYSNTWRRGPAGPVQQVSDAVLNGTKADF